jgi:galactose mutarotase-like enzyme
VWQPYHHLAAGPAAGRVKGGRYDLSPTESSLCQDPYFDDPEAR